MSSYLQQLQANSDALRTAIDDVLAEFRVLPVGSGYIDLIVPITDALDLIDRLALVPVAVTSVTWWCHCTPESRRHLGYPHGLGGPRALDGKTWFSECTHYPDLDLSARSVPVTDTTIAAHVLADACRAELRAYLLHEFPQEPFYSPCLCPGLWLHVPDAWQRTHYLVSNT